MQTSIFFNGLLTGFFIFSTLGIPTFCCAQEANLREDRENIALWTDDGLMLNFNRSDGWLNAIRCGDFSSPIIPAPLLRFEEVIPDPNAPDIIANTADNWLQDWNVPVEVGSLDGWLHVPGSAKWRPNRLLKLQQTEATPLILEANCRADFRLDANGWYGPGLAANVSGTYQNGGDLPYQAAYFGQYTHNAQNSTRVICPDAPIDTLRLSLDVPQGNCDAWFSDITLRPAKYEVTSPTLTCERIDKRLIQEFSLPESDLRGRLTVQPLAGAIEIACVFSSTKPVDRALSAYVAFPLDAIGGTWWDDPRTTREIKPNEIYRNVRWYGAGRDGYESRYPLSCITLPGGEVLSLGVDVGEPRVFCIEYDSRRKELRVRFDFGLSPDAGTWKNRGSFTAYLLRSDSRDGFRGATEKFHQLQSWAFCGKRAKREGQWIAFMSPQSVLDAGKDLHFQFVEAIGNMGWEDRQEMTSMRYAEPWIFHQESASHEKFPEASGPVDPQQAVALAQRMAAQRNPQMLPEHRQRFPAYLGSHILDQWGMPQGYYFRSENGRNENMMIVNPNPKIPPAPGAEYTSGAWDAEVIREAARTWKQWALDGWTLYRVTDKPNGEIDREVKAEGEQSLRFDPVRSKNYFEHYLRGVGQTVNCLETKGPYTFSFKTRIENMPPEGTGLRWTLEFISKDEKTQLHVVGLDNLTSDWQEITQSCEVPFEPLAVHMMLSNLPWNPNPVTLWIDDVSLKSQDSDTNLVTNGGFEQAELLPAKLDAVYLDVAECYECNINHRREHWLYADEPLTFDWSRKPGLHQIFSHTQYVRWMAEKSHFANSLVFGNCALTTPFTAPWLDVIGGEEFWLQGDRWSPKSDDSFLFTRFMSRAKPFCLLQYCDLDAAQIEKYVKRCLFYGVYPGNQSSSKVTGKWYWSNAARVYRDRPVYAKYVPFIQQIGQAGWQPVTLASSENNALWVERYGEGKTVYLTVFNPTAEPLETQIQLDSRLQIKPDTKVKELVTGTEAALDFTETQAAFKVSLASEDVRVYQFNIK